MSDCWFVYIVRCADRSLYTGITKDLERRVGEHNGHGGNGAKYTLPRRPVALVHHEIFPSRSLAMQREQAIKRLSAVEKAAVINE